MMIKRESPHANKQHLIFKKEFRWGLGLVVCFLQINHFRKEFIDNTQKLF